jgi:membrane protein DedA with SNARE-associated domain
MGLPLPEEIILVSAGYTCYVGRAEPLLLASTCGTAILIGDAIPFVLGRIIGPKILRVRLVRGWMSKRRLALFDEWFQRHGRLTIFVARFLTGIRVPAFFTAGSMRMSVGLFLLMDGLGVALSVPLFAGLGFAFGDKIETVLAWVRRLETGLLALVITGTAAAVGVLLWYRHRRGRRLLGTDVAEAFVGPPLPPAPPAAEAKEGREPRQENAPEPGEGTPPA